MAANRTIPSKIRVGPIWYRVVLSRAELATHRDGGPTMEGIADHAACTIYLDENLEPQYLRSVLLHELLHCAMMSNGMSRAYKHRFDEEQTVWHLTNPILGILRDNPLLVAFLMADDAEEVESGSDGTEER